MFSIILQPLFAFEIAALDKEFEEFHKQSKIPSIAVRRKYRSMVYAAELTVLKSGCDIVLCTCNEASSHCMAKSICPVYCIGKGLSTSLSERYAKNDTGAPLQKPYM